MEVFEAPAGEVIRKIHLREAALAERGAEDPGRRTRSAARHSSPRAGRGRRRRSRPRSAQACRPANGSSVVLPAPFGPTRPTTRPAGSASVQATITSPGFRRAHSAPTLHPTCLREALVSSSKRLVCSGDGTAWLGKLVGHRGALRREHARPPEKGYRLPSRQGLDR